MGTWTKNLRSIWWFNFDPHSFGVRRFRWPEPPEPTGLRVCAAENAPGLLLLPLRLLRRALRRRQRGVPRLPLGSGATRAECEEAGGTAEI